jgi:PadR family transcriptional regulator, regulatory protein PadR
MNNDHKEVQTKLTKGLLDMIVLQYLNHNDMHGYQVITQIRKDYGIYFGPSTIYPLLGLLEKKGSIQSTWDMNGERPRKMFKLTEQGKSILRFTENSLEMICKNLFTEEKVQVKPLLVH